MLSTITRILFVLALALPSGGRALADGPGPTVATASKVKLPDAPGSIAGLGAAAEASPFSGQVSYSVPFELPTGPAGVAPSSALSYAGELGNGTVGVGWHFGAPSIQRSTRDGVPGYDTTDELEVNGPASGRLIRIPDGSYRVEGAGNGFRVDRSGERWTVTDSQGTRYVYGLSDASRMASEGRVAAWMLELVIHPSGQRIDYAYERDRGALYLARVSWGPDRAYALHLTYEDRFDPVTSYRYGFEVVTARRLRSATVLSRGSELRTYRLSYDERFSLSRLASVKMTGFEGADELPAVAFRYADTGPVQTRALDGLGGWTLEQRGVATLDVDGDGMRDLARFELGNYEFRRNLGGRFGDRQRLPGLSSYELANLRLVDLDGDSRAELVRQVDDSWRASRLVDGRWQTLGEWPGSRGVPLFDPASAIVELNGDGRVDVIRATATGTQVWLNTARGFAPMRVLPRISAFDLQVAPGADNVRFVDANGDGLDDVVWLTDSWMKVFLGRGDGRFVAWRRSFYPWGTGSFDLARLHLVDLDRDGLLDLVRVTAGHVLYYRGRADGSIARDPRAVRRPDGLDADAAIAIADMNGNGSRDIVWSSPRGITLLDLAGTTTAGMLVAIESDLGATTRFTYAASAQLSVADSLAGRPWSHTLPLSIPVPTAVEVDVGDGSPVRRTRYRVRDGFWDGHERRFGGFLHARTEMVGAGAPDTSVSEIDYHPGLGADRVLRGRPVRTVLRDGNGAVHTITRTEWAAHPVADLPIGAPLLRIPVEREARVSHHEGSAAGVETLRWASYDGQGRAIETWKLGRLDLEGDESVTRRRYTSRDPATWIGDLPCEDIVADAAGNEVTRTRILYGDTEGIAGLCEPALGIARQTQAYLAEENRWVTQTRIEELSPNWNPRRVFELGVTRWFDYDVADERLIAETTRPQSGRDLTWRVRWDYVRGLMVGATDPAGVDTRVEYDGVARVVAIARGDRPAHKVFRYAWRGPSPTTRVYEFDGAESDLGPFSGWTATSSWRERATVANGAGEARFTAIRLTDDRWLVSGDSRRDARARVVSRTDPYEWSGADVRDAAPPADAARQTLAYDAFDRIVEQVLATGDRRTSSYRAFRHTSRVDGLAPVVRLFDGQGRIIRSERTVADGAGGTRVESVDAEYDAAGRILAMNLQDATVSHRFQYDSLGRLVYATDPDIGERYMTYSDHGLLLSKENGVGQQIAYTYDAIGRLRSVTGDDGGAYRFHYDVARDPAEFGNTATRLAWIEEPTGSVDIGYDAYGRQSVARRAIRDLDRDRDLVATESTEFSPSGLALAIDYHDGVALQLGYDRAGRLRSVGDYWTVDELDAAGRPLRETFGNGVEQRYTRDVLGRPSRIAVVPADAPPLYDVSLTHGPFGAIESVVDHDGVGLDHGASFTYDDAGRLTAAMLGAAGSGYAFSYRYDGLQNMIGRTVSGPSQLDVYSGQLRYGEAAADGTPTGPRQLTSVGDAAAPEATFAYDAAGRQIRHGGRVLHYNGFDQLTRVELAGAGAPSGAVEHAYGYDGFRVYTRDRSGNAQYWFSPSTTERNGVREHLLHVGDRLVARVSVGRIADLDGDAAPAASAAVDSHRGAVAVLLMALLALALALRRAATGGRRWVSAGAGAALFAMIGSLGCSGLFGSDSRPTWRTLETRYYHATVAPGPSLTTGEDGGLVEERRYEPFGAGIDSYRPVVGGFETGPIDYRRDPHNLLNQKSDPDTGWSYHGARWMAPQTGQWLTPDPPVKAPNAKYMASPWGLHPYQYVGNNPVQYWDPDGHDQICNTGCHRPNNLQQGTSEVGYARFGDRESVRAYHRALVKATGNITDFEAFFAVENGGLAENKRRGGAPSSVTSTAYYGYDNGNYTQVIIHKVHFPWGNAFYSRDGEYLGWDTTNGVAIPTAAPWDLLPVAAAAYVAKRLGRSLVTKLTSRSGPGKLVDGGYETYYRTMSRSHHQRFLETGRMPGTSETFISPTQAFSEGYQGVLVKFQMAPGTTARLREIGVRAHGNKSLELLPDLPLVKKRWGRSRAQFKPEGDQINIGLGREGGKALEIFNDSIRGFETVKAVK